MEIELNFFPTSICHLYINIMHNIRQTFATVKRIYNIRRIPITYKQKSYSYRYNRNKMNYVTCMIGRDKKENMERGRYLK